METQSAINFTRIKQAIQFIMAHVKEQPSLDEIASHIHLSPAHVQRLFSDWAGTSPKKFLQYLSIAHAKSILSKNKEITLFDVTYQTGLSSTSRLHDLFIKLEGMTPAEYKNGGANLTINYSFAASPFGEVFVASTPKGICALTFVLDEALALQNLKDQFPKAIFTQQKDALQRDALSIFNQDWANLPQIKLHLKGTDFQLKVWESLLKIPLGDLTTYGHIAQSIEKPKASRAVGTAIGSNPIAFLIPCHRVIQASGLIGGYLWGPSTKSAIIGWEASKINL